LKVRMPEGAVRAPRRKPERSREIIRCPTCGSYRLSPEIAFIGGAKYLCRDCGYRGSFVLKGDPGKEAPP
jgi:DNA-directed RNA polymerase subunit RPC12/RpoP